MFRPSKIQKSPHKRLVIGKSYNPLIRITLNSASNDEKQNKNILQEPFTRQNLVLPPPIQITNPIQIQKDQINEQIIQKAYSRSKNHRRSLYSVSSAVKQPFNRQRSNTLIFNSITPDTTRFPSISQEIFEIKREPSIDLANQIYAKLGQAFMIQTKASVTTIKKQKLIQFLSAFIGYLSAQSTHQTTPKQKSFFIFHTIFKKIQNKIKITQFNQKKTKLEIFNNIVKKKIVPQDCSTELMLIRKKMEQAKIQKSQLQLQINSLKNQLNSFLNKWQQKKQELVQWSRKVEELSVLYQSQVKQQEIMLSQIKTSQLRLQQINDKTKKITNFVEQQQQKKVLVWVSQAYKKIQAEIYDYACYLQCNALASSLTWEPKPFRAVEQWVMQQMQRVNKFIMSKEENVDDKAKKMRDFVMDTMRKFRTKDEEMMKVTDFKTECIKKFITMMQKWMQNWELKQQYLVDLRKQFVVKSQQINSILDNIIKDSQGSSLNTISQLKLVWEKVQTNYKFGNSFY